MVLCQGAPEGPTHSDSGFKASQKMGQQFKVSSYRLVEPQVEFGTPGYKLVVECGTPRYKVSDLSTTTCHYQLEIAFY